MFFHQRFEAGAHITFKGRKGLIIKEWGLRVITNKDAKYSSLSKMREKGSNLPLETVKVTESSSVNSSFEPKIQLPYNWLVSDKDEAERDEAKGKETDLFNLGLLTESSQ
ncbi:hypothetical protein TSUD_162150 [Trifolium subterraneum]|uniref:Uncharacterized protein n=1 Tax=Trifolium subterraneum TaxID=3900 RepID=A0A2Z6NFJ8_TRISU|nr:hypothetical protein TSUD_162150 [Trifolium subterraneum]